MAQDDSAVAGPKAIRRFDVWQMTHGYDCATDYPRAAWCHQDAKDDRDTPESRSQNGDQANQQHQGGEGDPDVDYSLEQEVEQTAEVAGDDANGRSQDSAD